MPLFYICLKKKLKENNTTMKTTTLNIINMKEVYIGAWTSPYLLSKLGLHVSDEPCCFKIKGATEIFIHQGETKSPF